MTEKLPADFRSRSIGDYLSALSSGSPTPGGGSAAGLAGALGCSLGQMVCNLTLARGQQEALVTLTERFAGIANELVTLAWRDEQAFAAYRAAIAIPRSTDEEKDARRAAIERALVAAADVPLEMIDHGVAAIDCLRRTAELGTPHALGDLMTGGWLLQAMSLGALENVEANASSMKVPANRERYKSAARIARHNLDTNVSALKQAVALKVN